MPDSNDQKNNKTKGAMRTMADDINHIRSGEDIKPEKIDLPNDGGDKKEGSATPNQSAEQNAKEQEGSLEELLPLSEDEAKDAPSAAPSSGPQPSTPKAPDAAQSGPDKKTEQPAPPPPPQSQEQTPQEAPQPFALSEEPKQGPSAPQPAPPPESKNRPGAKKFLVLGLVVVLIVAIGGGAAYFLLNGEGEEQVAESPENGEEAEENGQQIQPPPALVTPDMINHNLVAANAQATSLQSLLNNFKRDFERAGASSETITYMPIRLAGTEVEGSAEFIDAQAFIDGLGISVPEEFFDSIEQEFMLYAYNPDQEERVMCQDNFIAEEDCYGVRLGVVFQAQEGQVENIKNLASELEALVSPSSGISSLVLSNLATIPSEGIEFNSEEYQSTAVPSAPETRIRYYNLPMPGYDGLQLSATSIDIAVVEDYLIVSTSKNSMMHMIDRILEETTS